MGFDFYVGVLAAVLMGNGLTIAFVYAMFWGEAQRRKGVPEAQFPFWWILGAGAAPVIAAGTAYFTFH